LAGVIFAIENPNLGLVEPEEMDHNRILEISKPYLGEMIGEYTDWTPLYQRLWLFDEDVDEDDSFQFKNFLI
jgi:homospermidine synthase